jgi:hypothetical protein
VRLTSIKARKRALRPVARPEMEGHEGQPRAKTSNAIVGARATGEANSKENVTCTGTMKAGDRIEWRNKVPSREAWACGPLKASTRWICWFLVLDSSARQINVSRERQRDRSVPDTRLHVPTRSNAAHRPAVAV